MTVSETCQGGFVIEPVVVRAPQAGEVRVRLTAAGLCHTDHATLGGSAPATAPRA